MNRFSESSSNPAQNSRVARRRDAHWRDTHWDAPIWKYTAAAALALTSVICASADTRYHEHLFFDNSITVDAYFYSSGKATAPSILKLEGGKLPVESKISYTPPNALRLEWQSMPKGGWEAKINVVDFRNHEINFLGQTLFLWLYSPQAILSADLPFLRLSDARGNFSAPLTLNRFAGDIPANRWTQVKIPLDQIVTGSIYPFDAHRLQSIIFSQNAPDAVPHMLIVDEIKIDDSEASPPGGSSGNTTLPGPRNVNAKGYERHIDVSWDCVSDVRLQRYVIYRSFDGKEFHSIGIQEPGITRYTDFLGKPDQKATYKVSASDGQYRESPLSAEANAQTRNLTDEELLTMVQEACFRYYWEGAHPDVGMAPENIPGDDRIVATGASGFGIMALIVGVDRGFISRDAGLHRITKLVSFLENAPRYHGAWSHFMNGTTGESMPVFGMFDNAGDLVETSFLIEGLLVARQYFNGQNSAERILSQRITHLWETVEWDWYRRSPESDALYWHWSPDWSWHINHRLTGFNETMIVYLLAIASPTHAVAADIYYTGWAGQADAAVNYRQGWSGIGEGERYLNGHSYYGIKLDVGIGSGGPLFFAHYSYMGFD
ncbi:MAG: glucoamylase family protein, partial [Pyrinomonadaceae bacterium]